MTDTASSAPAPGLPDHNPFAAPSALPYGLPDFTRIRDEHYRPAFLAGMAAERAEVEAVVTDPAAPTVENTLESLERSGGVLGRVAAVFFNRTSSDTTDELDALEAELAPLLAEHHDAIELDPRLYERITALHARAEAGEVTLAPDAAWLLHELRRDMERAGVTLPETDKVRLRELNARLTTLETTFGRELLAETNDAAVLITDRDELDGLSEETIASARQAAQDRGHDDGWLLELLLFSQQPVLASLRRRDVRRHVHEASVTRGARGGPHDTRATLLELARLRAERAQLLGFEHHAAYVAGDGTARTAGAVEQMLGRLAPAAAANARREAADLERALRADVPSAGAGAEEVTLEPWDWALYAERVRAERFSLDDAQLRPYLELDRAVQDGIFYVAGELYGLTFTRREDLVGYHPDVEVYEVHDATDRGGAGIGLFLADWYTRASKHGGAWMNSLVDQSTLLGELPVVVNNLNIPKPPAGEPTLLTWDEVITVFHEFGHALHGLFSAVRFPSQSGTDVPRDFVEYPSQVNEMWAWEPEVLRRFAVHHRTGKPMPAAWVDTMIASRQFNEGFGTTEYLAAAILDQAWHRLAPGEVPTSADEVEAFEAQALETAGIAVPAVPPRYRTSYFNHVFGGGYAAAYYSYIWSEVLDAETVEWFIENGGLRRANGDRFRDALLSRGGSGDPMDAFRELRGREPRIEPLLDRRGLVPTEG